VPFAALQAVASRKIQPVPESLTARMLTADAMILIYSSNTIYVWLGKHLPAELRSTALSMADKLRFQNDLPADAHISLMKQGLEGPDFQSLFPDWHEAQVAALAELKALKAADAATGGSSASSRAVDVAAMALGAQLPEAPVDDGSGSKQVSYAAALRANTREGFDGRARRCCPSVFVHSVCLLSLPAHSKKLCTARVDGGRLCICS
jgi:hypothetical protein